MAWLDSLKSSGLVALRSRLPSEALSSTCQLTYLNFHLLFTIPPLLVLYLLARPFLTSLDRAKLLLLPLIAFVWTTPWDNVIVKFRAWSYPPTCVLARVGYVPVEEYAFFIIQSLMTTLLNVLLTRWTLPITMLPVVSSKGNRSWQRGEGRSLLGLGHDALFTPGFLLTFLVLVPPAAILSFAPGQARQLLHLAGHRFSSADIDHTYYMSMITWWALLPLGLLTWGTRSGMARTFRRSLGWSLCWAVSLVLPTVYLWLADLYALRRGTWHITEAKSLNVFPIPELPIEEMVFFVATNAILICACFAFERCLVVCYYRPELVASAETETEHPSLSPSHLPLSSWSTVKKLWQAFIVPGSLAAPPPAEKISNGNGKQSAQSGQRDLSDLSTALMVLGRASKSFSAAALLLPWDLRTDLSIVYAWCRAGDDLVDEEENLEDEASIKESKRAKMRLLHDLAEAMYGTEQRKSGAEEIRIAVGRCIERYAEGEEGRWAASGTGRDDRTRRLQELEACTMAGLPLRRVIPVRLWKELLRGYEIDLGFADAASPSKKPTQARSIGQGLRMKSDRELMEYAHCVAGCVGEMCTRVVLHRCGHPIIDEELEAAERELDLIARSKDLRIQEQGTAGKARGKRVKLDLDKPEDLRTLLRDARRMGVALQLVNIARDVASDARELKRCYLPLDPQGDQGWIGEALSSGRIWPSKEGSGLSDGSSHGAEDQRQVQPSDLRQPILDLLSVASDLFVVSFPSLASLPSAPARAGLRAACAVYFRIAATVRQSVGRQGWRGDRASLSKWQRIATALKAVYWEGS